MGTTIRPEISSKNKYWIDKHRYYELKHYCLQYPLWKKTYISYSDIGIPSPKLSYISGSSDYVDITAKRATMMAYYKNKIEQLERIANETDHFLGGYILKAVTEGLSFTYLDTKLNIPCGRDMYYDRYRKFFWLLSNERD